MSQIKKRICVILFLLIFFNIIHTTSAEEQFGISLYCYDKCDNKEIDYSKDIIIVLKIKNNLNHWVAIDGGRDGIDLKIEVENRNLEIGENLKAYDLGDTLFIKPKDEMEIYIPFDLYNNRNKNERLNNWKIYPELSFDSVKFYKNPFESKEESLTYSNGQRFYISSPVKGNVLEFTAVKPETEIQDNQPDFDIPESFWKNPINDKIIIPIIVGLIIAFIVYRIIKK